MSNAKRDPLLSDAEIAAIRYECDGVFDAIDMTIKAYEAARAKDAELIQRLVDCLHAVATLADRDADERATVARPGIDAAAAAGFKPSEQ